MTRTPASTSTGHKQKAIGMMRKTENERWLTFPVLFPFRSVAMPPGKINRLAGDAAVTPGKMILPTGKTPAALVAMHLTMILGLSRLVCVSPAGIRTASLLSNVLPPPVGVAKIC